MLKFEDTIVQFMQNRRETQLDFPPMSSYQRMVVHRLAARFGLAKEVTTVTLAGPCVACL